MSKRKTGWTETVTYRDGTKVSRPIHIEIKDTPLDLKARACKDPTHTKRDRRDRCVVCRDLLYDKKHLEETDPAICAQCGRAWRRRKTLDPKTLEELSGRCWDCWRAEHTRETRRRTSRRRQQRLRQARDAGGGVTDFQWEGIQIDYDFSCAYCGAKPEEGLTRDHDIPISRGGLDAPENVVPACFACNSLKRDMTGNEFRAYLETRPSG